MTLRNEFVRIAEAELGVVEKTTNRSARILEYRDATSLGRDGVPDAGWFWCSAFVCWCMREFLAKYQPERLPMRMKSARANDWETWEKYPGVRIMSPINTRARAGDIITFEFDGDVLAEHVGIVAEDQLSSAAPIHTIEGNTRPGTAMRDGGGRTDGVYRMTRPSKLVRKLVRWVE